MLEASAITPEVRRARGYQTLTKKADIVARGFKPWQARVPALLLPLHGVTGEIAGYQLRPDAPRVGRDGKPVKYETPGESRMAMDVPPGARPWLGDPSRPLFITEGVKKADAAVSRGLCCLGLLGVWNWRGTNEHGGRTALAEWESIAIKGREVYLAFDSDVTTKPNVRQALDRLSAFLQHRGANLTVLLLPAGPGATKQGLDDYFAAGHGVDDLLACAGELPPLPERPRPAPYAFEKDGIYCVPPQEAGGGPIRLTNFVARIAAETILDDGATEQRVLRLVARVGEVEAELEVPAREFDEMRWPTTHLGAGATLLPVPNVERHVRAAIQTTSGVKAPRRRVFTHTGWTRHEDAWVYLHARGALGAKGPVDQVEVQIDARLERFALPPAPGGEALATAFGSVCAFLDLAPLRLAAPLLGAVFRVVIDDCDFGIHLNGGTSTFKTSTAALAQQFFGPALDAQHLPGSWASTANAIEALAFYAKDAVLVVDDFAPTGGPALAGRLHQSAERLFRAQGNRQGRGRCAPDGSLRATRGPRGLVLSTGEDTPRGASLRARFLTLEVGPGDVDVARLTHLQGRAAAGEFAQVLSAFLQWLAPRLDDVRRRLAERVRELRVELGRDGRHRRVPGLLADLMFGIETLVAFGGEASLLSPGEAKDLTQRAWAGLEAAARAQEREQQESQPAQRFLTLLRSALTAGLAHVVGRDGGRPENPAAWGWQCAQAVGEGGESAALWTTRGTAVGWLDGEDLYLDAEAGVRAAQTVGSAGGDPLAVLPATLAKRLKEAGLLASTDPDGRHIEVQRRLSGAKRRVLHLAAETVMPTLDAGEDEVVEGEL